MLWSTILNRLGGILATVLLLVVIGAAAGVWIGVPYLERRWLFFPVKESREQPWQVPEGAEVVTFATADGVRLGGWFLGATGPRRGVTILTLHGNFGVLPRYMADAELLRRNGFNVLLFNYRGFGISGGITESEATLNLDAMAALRYLTQARGLDPTSIAFVGASLGAPVAATLATQAPCHAVALISTIASARRQAQRDWPWLPRFVLAGLRSPFDTAGEIGRARCPVAVVHGSKDQVVPVAQAYEVYAAARPPKRLIVVPEAAHGVSAADDPTYLDGLITFLTDPS